MNTDTGNFEGATETPWQLSGTRIFRNDLDGTTLICEAAPLDYSPDPSKERMANAYLLCAAPSLLAERDALREALSNLLISHNSFSKCSEPGKGVYRDEAKTVLARCGKGKV